MQHNSKMQTVMPIGSRAVFRGGAGGGGGGGR